MKKKKTIKKSLILLWCLLKKCDATNSMTFPELYYLVMFLY